MFVMFLACTGREKFIRGDRPAWPPGADISVDASMIPRIVAR
jgi:hypothetical protein